MARGDLPLGKGRRIDPTYAAAFNDLAIAYEHEGQLDKARKAYEKALELDPNNAQIRQNYELFKEINDRTGSAKKSSLALGASRRPSRADVACGANYLEIPIETPIQASSTSPRSSACWSPASSPAATKTSTPTRKPCACCAASCARNRRSR